MAEQLDQNVVALMKAIRTQESGNKAVLPQEKGIGGASIYQYTTGTWKGVAQKYLGNANAELNRANENKATYYRIKEWKDKGYKPAQIASMWNAGEGEPDAYTGKFKDGRPSIGTNSYGVQYNVPNHTKKVLANFQNEIKKLPQKTTPIQEVQPTEPEVEKNLITSGVPLAIKGIQKGVELAEKGIKATGLPWLVGKATQAAGGAIGGLIGGAAETARQAYKGVTGQGFDVGKIGTSAIQTAKETSQFGKFVGEEGAVAAPFAGLGKIPSAAIAAPVLYEGITEKDPTKIAIGTLGALGAKYSKGNWIDKAMFSSGVRTAEKEVGKVLPKEAKLAEQATSEMRTILRPTQGEIKNLEIRQGKNINDYYRLAAEEKLPIKETADKKLDTVEAVDMLKPKQEQLHNILNAQLDTNPSAQFDLLSIAERAKTELSKTIKNATDLKSAMKDVDEYVADAIELHGRRLTARQLNEFKSGMWSAGYNLMKPTAQSTARKLGHIAKEMIEEAYDDLTIRELNELSGKYATLSHLLQNANGRVVQGGAASRIASQVIGAVAGSHLPIVGSLAGQFVGGKVSDVIYSPVRRSLSAAKKAEKAGIAGKSLKETSERGVKALVEQKPKYLSLPSPKTQPVESIKLPYRTPSSIAKSSGALPQPYIPPAQQVARPGQKLITEKASSKIITPPPTTYEAPAKIIGNVSRPPISSKTPSAKWLDKNAETVTSIRTAKDAFNNGYEVVPVVERMGELELSKPIKSIKDFDNFIGGEGESFYLYKKGLPVYSKNNPSVGKTVNEINFSNKSINNTAREVAPNLSSDQRIVEAKAFKRIDESSDKILKDYFSKKGKVVNTDEFRNYFREDGYTGSNSASVQEPASELAKKAYSEALKNNGKYATLYAGGSGTGKTSAIKNINSVRGLVDESAVILDGNLSSYNSAIKKITEAVNAGKKTPIVYVYREPVDSMINGVVKRALTNPDEAGRIVPASVTAENHIGSLETIKKLSNDGYDVFVIDNSKGVGKAKISSISELNIKYPSLNELTNQFKNEIKKLYDNPKATKEKFGRELTKDEYEKFVE